MSPAPLINAKTYGILGIRHGIEWASAIGEFIDDVVIGIIFLFDQTRLAAFHLRCCQKDCLEREKQKG